MGLRLCQNKNLTSFIYLVFAQFLITLWVKVQFYTLKKTTS